MATAKNPTQKGEYNQTISQIYQEMGNDRESRRYLMMAQKFEEEEIEPE